jgi:trans-aconitate methyltransferase
LQKANILKKIYIYLIIPVNYFIEKLNYPKVINLDNYANDNKKIFKKNLNFLFEYFNSDKGNKFINQYARFSKKNNKLIKGHKYATYYEKFTKKIKKNFLNILEIGSFKGNATASFFFYFKNAFIYSLDLYPDLFIYKSKRIKNLRIDNSSEKELLTLPKKIKYDLIIEDAGHYLKDQIITLFTLFPKLKKKGIYVVEELDFPDTRNDMNLTNDKNTLYNILKLIKKNKTFYSSYVSEEKKKYFFKNYKYIKIYKGRFNKIAFILKK